MNVDKITSFTDVDVVAISLIIVFLFLLCLSVYDDIRTYRKLRDRVDDIQYRFNCLQSKYDNHRYIVIKNISELSSQIDVIEKQIANISKTSAEFFCATNNRIADISTVVDTLDCNVDDLFDENFNRCQSITSLKNDIDSITYCINCKKSSPFKRFIK